MINGNPKEAFFALSCKKRTFVNRRLVVTISTIRLTKSMRTMLNALSRALRTRLKFKFSILKYIKIFIVPSYYIIFFFQFLYSKPLPLPLQVKPLFCIHIRLKLFELKSFGLKSLSIENDNEEDEQS